MPLQSASADPAIKIAILHGVFEQNKAMIDPARRQNSKRRRRSKQAPVPGGNTPTYYLPRFLIAWILLTVVPGNTGFLAMSTQEKMSAPESANALATPLTPAPSPSSADVGMGSPAADATTTLAPGAASMDPLSRELGLTGSLLSLAELPGVDSLSVAGSQQSVPHPPLLDAPSALATDEYLSASVLGPDGYAPLLTHAEFSLAVLFGLEVKNIVIDPGHGGSDPGATGLAGNREKDITLDIALRLQQRLSRRPQYRVLLTRDSDVKMSLKERVAFAAEKGADLFVSIHINALPEQPVNLVETYYFGPYADDRTLQLAKLENQGSDYAVADFNTLIQKIGNTLKTQESRQLAADLQASLVSNLQRHDGRIIDAGIKTAPFVVLLGVDVPSVLAEVSCISNAEEEARLATGEHRSGIAASIERGIIRYLEKKSNSRLTADGELNNGSKKERNG